MPILRRTSIVVGIAFALILAQSAFASINGGGAPASGSPQMPALTNGGASPLFPGQGQADDPVRPARPHRPHKAPRPSGPRCKRSMRMTATAYGPPWGGIQGQGITATGIRLNGPRHLIAVDPSMIKLGSRVRISPNPHGWKGAYLAGDTGGAIDGYRIDIYDWRGRSSQYAWGRRPVRVCVL